MYKYDKHIHFCLVLTSDSTGNSEKSKLFSLVLVMTFLLVDFQSSSGFVQCVMYPASRDMCLAVWEVLYIVALIIYMPVKCFYRLVVEILIYELYDTFLALFSMPVNIGKICFSHLLICMKVLESSFLITAGQDYSRELYTLLSLCIF